MKIIIARSAIETFYEPSWVRALSENGHDVRLFDLLGHIAPRGPADRWGWLQHRLLWGPRVTAANRALVDAVRAFSPDVALLYLGHHVRPETVSALRQLAFVALYHSDDPFGPRRAHPRYRVLHKSWPLFDGAHFYRTVTAQSAHAAGVRRAEVLLDFYRPWEDFPRPGPPRHEAAFIGHFEPDARVACIVAAVRASLPLKVYSNERAWRGQLPADVAVQAGPQSGLYGEAYREHLSRAKVSVCFLSCWNRDVYTKRVFEIPACGGFLFCQRTPFMQALYEEDREAAYFDSPDEFVDKLRFYLTHESARAAIAAAGHARVKAGGHDIHSRLAQWATTITRWRSESR